MAKKSKPTPEGLSFLHFLELLLLFFCSRSVICLSDDDDDDNTKSNALISTPAKQQASPTSNGEKKSESSHLSDWLVQRKDIIRIPELSIKHADLMKKSLELLCSAVCFGMVEFNVESETIFLRETEFELKLKGTNQIFFRKKSNEFCFSRRFYG